MFTELFVTHQSKIMFMIKHRLEAQPMYPIKHMIAMYLSKKIESIRKLSSKDLKLFTDLAFITSEGKLFQSLLK